MDRRKVSRSLRSSAEGVKIKVKSICPTSTAVLMENQNPSIYEIDILSSFEFQKNKKKETNDVPVKMSVAKAATRVLEIKGEESTKKEEKKIYEIPLLKSYYPTFQQVQSKVRSISFEKKKMDSKIQTDINFGRKRQEENEEKASKEKADKENHFPAEDLKEFLKNIMIENFILKDDPDSKTMFKNLYKKLNKDQLHLHHHEHHHHHYYFDNSTLLNENISSFPFKQTFPNSQRVKSVDKWQFSKDKKHQTGKAKVIEREQPTQTYYFKCPRGSDLTYTKTSSDSSLKSESNESSKAKVTSKVKEKKSSGIFESSLVKFSSSVESIINKKSDFITTHIYSDTELKKCDREILHEEAISESKKASWKESKNYENNNYNSVLNDLKNFNHSVASKVIADQKTALQTSFVRCECSSLEGSNSASNGKSFNDIRNSGANIENQERTRFVESDVEEYVEKETGRYDNEIWTTKLKTELGKIKKKLKRIEERRLHKRKSFTSTLNNNKSIEGSNSSHNITVYSSKTFIVGADNFCLTHKDDQEQFEDKIQAISKIKFVLQEPENERERWHYREKKCFFEKTVLN